MGAMTLTGVAIVATVRFSGTFIDQIDRGCFLCFLFSGALAFAPRDRIALKGWLAAGVALLIAILCVIAGPAWRAVAPAISLPYLIFWSAYVPAGFLRLYKRLGDYFTELTSSPRRNCILRVASVYDLLRGDRAIIGNE